LLSASQPKVQGCEVSSGGGESGVFEAELTCEARHGHAKGGPGAAPTKQYPLGKGALAGHDADEFAVAPGGQGLAPGNPLAIPEGGHAVDGIDEGAVVAQQDMAHTLLIEGGQVELGSSLGGPGGGFTHDGLISVFG
jgi:hypothetical protein